MRKKLNACSSTLKVKFELAVPNNSKLEHIFLSVKKVNGKKPFASVSVLALVYSWKNERSKKNLKIKIEEFCYPEVHDTSSAI